MPTIFTPAIDLTLPQSKPLVFDTGEEVDENKDESKGDGVETSGTVASKNADDDDDDDEQHCLLHSEYKKAKRKVSSPLLENL